MRPPAATDTAARHNCTLRLPKAMRNAQEATCQDLRQLIANIDQSLQRAGHDAADIRHMRTWREELVAQVEELERGL